MKDKRQRIAVAWPYAAVYSDPAFAASILQAAANSVGMPYGYAPNPMMPQMMPQNNHFSYGYRYAPYPIPPRNTMPGSGYSSVLGGMPQSGYTQLSIPKPHTPPHDLQSQASPQSSLSLSPGSDKSKFDSSCSPIKSPPAVGLLMTAPQTQTTLLQTPEKPKLFKPYKSEA
jgi:homeobox even-skipped homolog protein